MNKKIFLVIFFLILLGVFNSVQDAIINSSVVKKWLNTNNDNFGEKYKLTCKVGLTDLKGTSLSDKARFVGKNINLVIDTKVGVYSEDYKDESDLVILHGIWPEVKFTTISEHYIAWSNELIIDENRTLYIYRSDIRKNNNSILDKILKKDKMKLNIVISEYSLRDNLPNKSLQKLFKKKQLEEGIITQEQFDKWMDNLTSLPTSNTDELPKKYMGLFSFKFDCLKNVI